MNGSIGPGLEVTFILTLKPSKLTREIRIDVSKWTCLFIFYMDIER